MADLLVTNPPTYRIYLKYVHVGIESDLRNGFCLSASALTFGFGYCVLRTAPAFALSFLGFLLFCCAGVQTLVGRVANMVP